MELRDIHKIQLQERKSGVLMKLEKDFYRQCYELLQSKKAMLDSHYSELARNDFENARNVFKDLVLRRNQKILLKALGDLKASAVSIDGLTEEEQGFYTTLLDVLNKHHLSMANIFEAKPSLKKKIKILQDLPSFISSSAQVIGPFYSGDEVEVASTDARSLVEKNLAVII